MVRRPGLAPRAMQPDRGRNRSQFPSLPDNEMAHPRSLRPPTCLSTLSMFSSAPAFGGIRVVL